MPEVEVTTDLEYAVVDGHPLLADLYRPVVEPGRPAPPVVVYVHGGGFQAGSRTDGGPGRLRALAAHGLAVLSVDYRLAPAVHFPAPLHDVKAAVRWVRARASQLGVDSGRVAIWGASAGAILAALVGLTADHADLTGRVGEHADQPSAVDAVVTWFAASDLLGTATRSWLEAELLPAGFEAALLGVDSHRDVPGVAELARQASPLTWVSGDAPPFLVVHGDRDRMVPVAESQRLHDALVRSGADSSLLIVGGAGHEDTAFDAATVIALTAGFLLAATGRRSDQP